MRKRDRRGTIETNKSGGIIKPLMNPRSRCNHILAGGKDKNQHDWALWDIELAKSSSWWGTGTAERGEEMYIEMQGY